MSVSRRTFIGAAGAGLIAAPLIGMPGGRASAGRSAATRRSTLTSAQICTLPDAQLLDDIEHRTFDFFWDQVNHANGLMVDRWPTRSFASIAATGFALAAWPIGAERGWITRDQARNVTLRTLRFLDRLPQGDQRAGTAGYRGFYYHFLDGETGLRYRDTELSTVDTAWLQMGMTCAQGWFDRDQPQEREIRALVQRQLDRTEWDWMQTNSTGGVGISMGWHPESGFIARNWDGYNEGMAVYLLALGSQTHPASDGAYQFWTASYPHCWRGNDANRYLSFGPHFGHLWGPMFIDYRGIYDAPMRRAGFDYFENCRRATYAQRDYAITNPMGWDGYSKDIWGMTASDGPGNIIADFNGRLTQFEGYSAYGAQGMPDQNDNGTGADGRRQFRPIRAGDLYSRDKSPVLLSGWTALRQVWLS